MFQGVSVLIDLETLHELGAGLILVGSVIIAIAFLLLLISGVKGKGRIKGGGVVLIGPIPIVFGSDAEHVTKILLLSLVLTMVAMIVLVIYSQLLR
jgi:uncharacterized protein (TIGR00304 family)